VCDVVATRTDDIESNQLGDGRSEETFDSEGSTPKNSTKTQGRFLGQSGEVFSITFRREKK